VRIALAQINPTVGDIKGNTELIVAWVARARAQGARVVVFPELAISGYPPEDLVLKDHFLARCREALDEVSRSCTDVVALVGVPLAGEGVAYNSAAVLAGGAVTGFYRKILLPNYAVFDEKRYFAAGDRAVVLCVDGVRLGVTICEDIWQDDGPGETAAVMGDAGVILNLSMSPYHRGKGRERKSMLAARAKAAHAYILYVNGVGGQDELVFDGQSVVFDPAGTLVARACQFDEELLMVDVDSSPRSGGLEDAVGGVVPSGGAGTGAAAGCVTVRTWPVEEIEIPASATAASAKVGARGAMPSVLLRVCEPLEPEAEVYSALCLGVRDYTRKNGFKQVVMGISGGIDSALTACIAADALGKERVNTVSMPSRYSSEGTKGDAYETAGRLGVRYHEIPIETLYRAYLESLRPHLDDLPGVAEQNIQARIRGNLLMALSNEFGWLVLTTGNKSEMAVGYATLYGDMAGGFSVLKDVPKTLVYRLAQYRNAFSFGASPIPESTITRAPSAELAPDQTDQDTLPPYDILDRIIEAYVVCDDSVDEIVALGIDRTLVLRVLAMIDGNEYKRRQSAPGVRITPKAFGKDRRLPITNRYRG
jgi:NAD+ synthase (glutamine-hydrolysing)